MKDNVKSGFYKIQNGELLPANEKESEQINRLTMLYKSKHPERVNLDKFTGCILWLTNTPINIDIEIYGQYPNQE